MTNPTENEEFEALDEDEFLPPNPFLLDLANGLYWVGSVIVAFFIVGFFFQLFPFTPLNPEWLQKTSGALMMNGVTPLVGAIFILVAPLASPDSEALERRAWLVRQLSIFAAIGYLLLIPVQIYSGIWLMNIEKRNQQDILDRVQEAVKDLEKSTTASQLRAAYALIPGDKPILGDQFTKPVEVIRDQLLEQIKPNIIRAEIVFNSRMTTLWRQWIPTLTQNSLRLIILFLGYAAIGHHPDSNYTMLEFILQLLKKRRKPTAGPTSQTGAGEVMEEEQI
jgi:hypothetical protein